MGRIPQIERYCPTCDKYSVAPHVGPINCEVCNTELRIILKCKTCGKIYSVKAVTLTLKCPTCNLPLRLDYIQL